ncbi:MAG TPA: VIT1/CCC1 transporter family protein [Candidatus Sulfotelmatobacter sp.]|nr:VIT1/CCC1 transporter family protein [Candidatus Sulfotelmatobacter sp.]
MDDKIKKTLLGSQRNESTEHAIYLALAGLEKSPRNQTVLKEIAGDELRHYGEWQKLTGQAVAPDRFKIFRSVLLARFLGVTFAVKLMEAGEAMAQDAYAELAKAVPAAAEIVKDEARHETLLVGMIDEERLKYIGSVVLGLNDALVELTGTLAGLTFALQNARLVGVAGLITGIAASLSMAASEYLSTQAEGGEKNPLRAAIYTGITYVLAVTVLIVPFFALPNHLLSLPVSLLGAVVMIFVFTYYYSVVKGVSFRRRFLEMVTVSLSVAALSFLIGLLARRLIGVDV